MDPKPIWRIRRPPSRDAVAGLSEYRPVEQALLLARDIRSNHEAGQYLRDDSPRFNDPFQMAGMDQAVSVIEDIVSANGHICIYADYDADGITGASILYQAISALGKAPLVYFPDRFAEGYGLNVGAIDHLISERIDLIISVDCGIRGLEEVDHARKHGLQVIITDHHLPGDQLPDASCILNPQQPGDTYPSKDLAGTGVAFKLAQGLSSVSRSSRGVEEFLDLVAIGTVADMVPLVGENRHLVQQGIRAMNQALRPGLEALIHVAGIASGSINSDTIGFGIGPRINAAGRIASANQAFSLLVEEDPENAQSLAERLDRLNRERQKLTSDVLERVEEATPASAEKMIFSFDPDYHPGVVGLAASRVSDRFHRPAIIGTVGDAFTRASARSIPGFHITEVLTEVSDLLTRYGGHQSAAGFTVENRQRDRLIDRMMGIANERISAGMLTPVQEIDACISLGLVDETLMSFLDKLEPFGNQNPKPIFCSEGVQVLSKRIVGRDSSHLKMTLKGEGKPFDAIAFRMGDRYPTLSDRLNIAFHIERNNYLGYETIQLQIVDLREEHSLKDSSHTEWVEPV